MYVDGLHGHFRYHVEKRVTILAYHVHRNTTIEIHVNEFSVNLITINIRRMMQDMWMTENKKFLYI